jgi:DNA-binding transcriptional ArsR family regulator
MKDGPNIARIASLLGDSARAEALTALMTDRALTATELSALAGVTKQTMSAHLSKLLDARLIAVDQQGRHRYFRLADADVAHLLESLMGVAFRTGAVRLLSSPREPALRKARICYDHLAGELGVTAFENLLRARVCGPGGVSPPPRRTAYGSLHPAPNGSRKSASTPPPPRSSAGPCAARAWIGASGANTWPARWVRRCSGVFASWGGRNGTPARA